MAIRTLTRRALAPMRAAPMLAAAFALAACDTNRAQTAAQTPPQAVAESGLPVETITLAGRPFEIELALDHQSRETGLSYRDSLDPDAGMLFVFPDAALRRFWMYECRFDIDIMFLGPTGRITAIHTMPADPRREGESDRRYQSRLAGYGSKYAAQFAIELTAGTIGELGLSPGDVVELDLERLKALAE